ncbi:hypothetical protein JCM9492_11130 [Aquifex pyrophilus]
MRGQKRTKADIFLKEIPLKFLEINGKIIPLIGGGAEGDDAPAPDDQNTEPEPQAQTQPQDIDAIVQQKLDEYARSLGFEDFDDLQMKLLEKEGKTQEYIDKLRENYTKQLAELQKQAETYKKLYEETVLKNAILTTATQKGAVDPEIIFTMLKDRAILDGDRILVDGKPVEEAVEELLEKKPYLRKASPPGTGAPNTTTAEPQDFEELLKNPQKLLEVKKNNPELFEKLKSEYLAKKLRR